MTYDFAIETWDCKLSNSRGVGDVFVNRNYIFLAVCCGNFPAKFSLETTSVAYISLNTNSLQLKTWKQTHLVTNIKLLKSQLIWKGHFSLQEYLNCMEIEVITIMENVRCPAHTGSQYRNLVTHTWNLVAWENSRHFMRLPLQPSQNDVWVANAEIPYWWLVSTQILVVLLIGWNFLSTNQKHYQDLGRDASSV